MTALLWMFVSLVLTIAVECGLSLFFRSKQLSYSVLLCNLLTNPLLNFILLIVVYVWGPEPYLIVLAVLEVAAVVVETFVIRLMNSYSTLRAFALALLFNAASFCVGLLLW